VKEKKSSPFILLFVLGFILVAGFLMWPVPEKTKQIQNQGNISASSQQAEELVNKHLWMTGRAQELAQEQMQAQNAFSNPQVGESILPEAKKENKQLGVDHSSDSNETTAFDDLNRYPKKLEAQSPDHVIQAQLSDADRRREYEETYRAEYARQFVENARRNGYDVVLNDNYVVISVRPIRNPSGQLGPQAQ